ncbi:hypothetical protein CKO44_24825 [Rubrivivax gelatinosus]|uniref:DUF4390 domain-containing protein n=1 Tax=Rubrivivax gelatinosus TaxID=28068 RepID=UPI0019060623|nr:DUF4390 domain-containing protein [Rubrivivax gelatinosus]MBK1616669.1 hypothetical protein [Rubrivivax gelatinosus]
MRSPPVRRRLLQGLGLWMLLGWLAVGAALVRAQGVDLTQLQVGRGDGALTLEFAARVTLPKAVEEAMTRGVPVYFVAQATLRRDRWYWRDERVARVTRSWRVVYQALTSSWRVGLGGLNQSYPTLAEAMAAVTRSAGWRIADLSQLEPGKDYYVEFSWRLDTTQLPSPMQIGLGGQADWALGAERELPVELP